MRSEAFSVVSSNEPMSLIDRSVAPVCSLLFIGISSTQRRATARELRLEIDADYSYRDAISGHFLVGMR